MAYEERERERERMQEKSKIYGQQWTKIIKKLHNSHEIFTCFHYIFISHHIIYALN